MSPRAEEMLLLLKKEITEGYYTREGKPRYWSRRPSHPEPYKGRDGMIHLTYSAQLPPYKAFALTDITELLVAGFVVEKWIGEGLSYWVLANEHRTANKI